MISIGSWLFNAQSAVPKYRRAWDIFGREITKQNSDYMCIMELAPTEVRSVPLNQFFPALNRALMQNYGLTREAMDDYVTHYRRLYRCVSPEYVQQMGQISQRYLRARAEMDAAHGIVPQESNENLLDRVLELATAINERRQEQRLRGEMDAVRGITPHQIAARETLAEIDAYHGRITRATKEPESKPNTHGCSDNDYAKVRFFMDGQTSVKHENR